MKTRFLVPALTLLSASAALAISNPLTPPPVGDLGVDFRTRAFSSINGQIQSSGSSVIVDQFDFGADPLSPFTWSPKYGVGTTGQASIGVSDPGVVIALDLSVVGGPETAANDKLAHEVVTGIWLDDVTGPVEVTGNRGNSFLVTFYPDRYGDVFIPLNPAQQTPFERRSLMSYTDVNANDFDSPIITPADKQDKPDFDIAGFTTEPIRAVRAFATVPEGGSSWLLLLLGLIPFLGRFKKVRRVSV